MKKINYYFMRFFTILFFIIGFFRIGLGQKATIFSEDCSTQPGAWTFFEVEQKSGHWLEYSSTDYVYTSVFGASTDLSLTTNLRSYGGGNAPECTIDISTDGGTTWTGGTYVISDISNTYTDYDWNIGTLAGSNNIIRWRRTSVNSRGLRINDIILTGELTSPSPEPDNYPTDFTANANSSNKIDLTWTDASDDAQNPHGYLIKANKTGTFTSPVDGVESSEDTYLADGSALVKVAQGTGTYSFSDLDVSTQYFFKVWSYTNSDTDIDFKTDGTPPTADATTTGTPLITITASLNDFGNQCTNAYSDEQSYLVSGSDIEGNITVTAPSNFEISETSGSGFGETVTLIPANGTVNTTIYAVFYPTSSGIKSGNISHSSIYATTKNQAVSGTGISAANISTTTASNIGISSASSGGNVTDEGESSVTAKGICWSTNADPTTANSYTTDGTGEGSFVSSITGLNTNATYHIRAYATNTCGTSYGSDEQFTTLKNEPENHPSNFTCGTISSNTIPLTWSDATGTILPDKYLIKWSSTNFDDITAPSDGIEEYDGVGIYNASQGDESYTATGLNSNVTYYFKIWSYTNSGSNTDYKTDGSIQQTNCTTIDAPCIDEDFSDFSDWTDNGTATDNTASHSGNATPCRALGSGDNLISPSVDYPGELQFYQDASNGGNGNTATVEYKIGSGGTWTSCYSFSVSASGVTETVDLTDLSGVNLSLQQEVYFRFASTFSTWYLDDVAVECLSAPTTDSNSEIYAPTTQITASSIISTATSFTDVFKFVIQDQTGGDEVNTIVTNVRIKPHGTNTADWTDNIQSVKLNDGSDISIENIDIQDTYIDINISAGNLLALDDGTEKIVTLSIQLNENNLTDNSVLSFMIDADAHGFTTDAGGSDFATTFASGDFNSNDFTITVNASKLIFSTIPTSVELNTNFTIAVSSSDANGNIDTDETSDVSLVLASGNGNLSSATGLTNKTLTSGTYTWNDIQYDSEEIITIEAQSSTLTNVTSNSVTIATFQDGDYRTTGSGLWEDNTSSPEIWEQMVSGSWQTSNSPDYTTSENIYIETGHILTSGGAFASSVNIKVNGGEFIVNNNSTAGSVQLITGNFTVNSGIVFTMPASSNITVENGGIFNANSSNINVNSSATLTVENGGVLKINNSGFTNDNSIFNGTEDFQDGSTVEILDWNWSASISQRSLISSNSDFSYNAQGYKFGNLTLNATLTDEWTLISGSMGVINLCYNDFTINNGSADNYVSGASNKSGTNGYVINGNLIINSGNFYFGTSYSTGSFNHQFTINGNLEYNGSGTFKIHANANNTSSSLEGYVNVGGNLTLSSSADFTNDIASDNSAMYLNFSGTSTQTLDIGCTATGISMNIVDGATVQLANNDLTLNSFTNFDTEFTVKTGGTLHFGYAGNNSGLKIIDANPKDGSIKFISEANSILKITSANGISESENELGNVYLPSSNKTFNQEATFHYVGKINQVTGDALENGSTGKVVIAELLDTKTLTLTNSVQIDDAITVNATVGGYLEIKTGIVTETSDAYFYGDGTITMSGGKYIIPGISVDATDYLPRLKGTLRAYNISGGTIEFNGITNGTTNYIRSGVYYDVIFSNGSKK